MSLSILFLKNENLDCMHALRNLTPEKLSPLDLSQSIVVIPHYSHMIWPWYYCLSIDSCSYSEKCCWTAHSKYNITPFNKHKMGKIKESTHKMEGMWLTFCLPTNCLPQWRSLQNLSLMVWKLNLLTFFATTLWLPSPLLQHLRNHDDAHEGEVYVCWEGNIRGKKKKKNKKEHRKKEKKKRMI